MASSEDLDAFFRGEAVCEQHPDKPWPHDDCPGAGMPPRLVEVSLTRNEAAELLAATALAARHWTEDARDVELLAAAADKLRQALGDDDG